MVARRNDRPFTMEEWAREHGLKPAPNGQHFDPCWCWFQDNKGIRGYHWCQNRRTYLWFDHTTGWVGKDGTRVLVSQPYGLSKAERESLRLIEEEGYRVQIEPPGYGWHNELTHFVAVWREPEVDR